MAKVTVCDRCGKHCDELSIRSYSFRKLFITANLFEPRLLTNSNHDLCPDCALELDKFFEGKATDAVVKE